MAAIAERVCGSKENQPAYSIRMAGSQHHRHSATMRMARDVGLFEAKSIHPCGYAVCSSFKSRIQSRDWQPEGEGSAERRRMAS